MQICLCRMPPAPMRQVSGVFPIAPCRIGNGVILWHVNRERMAFRASKIRASVVDSQEGSSNFAKRIEQAWLISKQPRPITCTTCESNGSVECKWCAGTGFFILGNNMLCQVPSKNTSCVICSGKKLRGELEKLLNRKIEELGIDISLEGRGVVAAATELLHNQNVQQSKIQLWRSNHVKKSGEFVNDAAKNAYEKMIEYETTSMEEGAEEMPEDDILVAALGRRSGYQKGMGYGVEVSRGTNSIAKTFELQAQLQRSNEKIDNLTVQLGRQMEENKVNKEQITSLDAQLVENRKENESNKKTINNLQAQMNQLMSIVNGLSASRNEGTLHRRKH